MGATVIKSLKLPVGSWGEGDDAKTEYVEIGVLIEFSNDRGDKWPGIRLDAHILNPSLLAMARQKMERGSSKCMVKCFDVAKRVKASDGGEQAPPAAADDDHIPF